MAEHEENLFKDFVITAQSHMSTGNSELKTRKSDCKRWIFFFFFFTKLGK